MLLGVCDSPTAFKSVELVGELRKRGADIRVALADLASKYMTPAGFERMSGRKTIAGSRGAGDLPALDSLDFDLVVIAPASFSFMEKMSSGLRNDFLVRLAVLADKPVVIVPDIEEDKYSQEAAEARLTDLKERGFHVVPPEVRGEESYVDQKIPVIWNIEEVLRKISSVFARNRLFDDKKVLITSGPTKKRFSSIPSAEGGGSSSLGFRLSGQVRKMGAEVLLISGPTEKIPPPGVGTLWVKTVRELDELLEQEYQDYDLIFMVASGSEWVTKERNLRLDGEKTERLDFDLEKPPDLTRKYGRLKKENQVIIGFVNGESIDPTNEEQWLVENDVDGEVCVDMNKDSRGKESSPDFLILRNGEIRKFRAENEYRKSRAMLTEIRSHFFDREE